MAEGGEDDLAQLIVYTQTSKEVFNTLPEIEPDTTQLEHSKPDEKWYKSREISRRQNKQGFLRTYKDWENAC